LVEFQSISDRTQATFGDLVAMPRAATSAPTDD
jgi:hypothetical protein